MNQSVADEEVERYAKALWDQRESRRDAVGLLGEPPREWSKYAKGKENYDCDRFEYNRDDIRSLVRGMLERLA